MSMFILYSTNLTDPDMETMLNFFLRGVLPPLHPKSNREVDEIFAAFSLNLDALRTGGKNVYTPVINDPIHQESACESGSMIPLVECRGGQLSAVKVEANDVKEEEEEDDFDDMMDEENFKNDPAFKALVMGEKPDPLEAHSETEPCKILPNIQKGYKGVRVKNAIKAYNADKTTPSTKQKQRTNIRVTMTANWGKYEHIHNNSDKKAAMEEALRMVREEGVKIKAAAETCNVKYDNLYRRLRMGQVESLTRLSFASSPYILSVFHQSSSLLCCVPSTAFPDRFGDIFILHGLDLPFVEKLA